MHFVKLVSKQHATTCFLIWLFLVFLYRSLGIFGDVVVASLCHTHTQKILWDADVHDHDHDVDVDDDHHHVCGLMLCDYHCDASLPVHANMHEMYENLITRNQLINRSIRSYVFFFFNTMLFCVFCAYNFFSFACPLECQSFYNNNKTCIDNNNGNKNSIHHLIESNDCRFFMRKSIIWKSSSAHTVWHSIFFFFQNVVGICRKWDVIDFGQSSTHIQYSLDCMGKKVNLIVWFLCCRLLLGDDRFAWLMYVGLFICLFACACEWW